MKPSSRTPEDQPNSCPVCGNDIQIEASLPLGDAPCPRCGHLLWFPALDGLTTFDFFVGDGIIYELDVSTKLEAIEILVQRLSELGHLRPLTLPSVVDALMHREKLGSTGIGCGIAVPHAKHEAVDHIVAIFGHIPGGIDFNSLDGEPVTKIFLLLSPHGQTTEHLRALARISRLLQAPRSSGE